MRSDSTCKENRNNNMMKFLAFKVLSGEMDFIRYEVFVGGHGHCLCDGMFGVCKCYYRKCRVISFDELLETVRKCSSMQSFEKTDETSLRLWGDELNKFFSTIPNITQYWVFEFERVEDGVMVRMKRRRSDERSVDINLLKAEFFWLRPIFFPWLADVSRSSR